MVKYLKKFDIAYEIIPCRRDQDVIRIFGNRDKYKCIVSLVDGYNNLKFIDGNSAGRRTAEVVANKFPELFVETEGKNLEKKTRIAVRLMDMQVLHLYPAYSSCVGAFLFETKKTYIIIAVGSVVVYIRNGQGWFKPKEIKDYSLDLKIYPADVSRFFGLGELKKQNPELFKCDADVIEIEKTSPVFLASDGYEDIFDLESLNKFTHKLKDKSPKNFIKRLGEEIKNGQKQKDDISILIKGSIS